MNKTILLAGCFLLAFLALAGCAAVASPAPPASTPPAPQEGTALDGWDGLVTDENLDRDAAQPHNWWIVDWSGSDAHSGLAYYDVQVKKGAGGTWVNWRTGVSDARGLFLHAASGSVRAKHPPPKCTVTVSGLWRRMLRPYCRWRGTGNHFEEVLWREYTLLPMLTPISTQL